MSLEELMSCENPILNYGVDSKDYKMKVFYEESPTLIILYLFYFSLFTTFLFKDDCQHSETLHTVHLLYTSWRECILNKEQLINHKCSQL